MGSYSPNEAMTPALLDQVVAQILVPVVHAMNREDRTYKGILYAGLMLTKGGPKVLEFNVRFGDPETQPVMMRLKSDLVDIMEAVIEERLEGVELDYDERAACCVVMASEGYPGPTRIGRRIEGLDSVESADDLQVFHAGTSASQTGEGVVTSGGRVLGISALGQSHEEARQRAYEASEKISFQGAQKRSDIGR
jgi:phosphoribosylamine--glycine ligase